MSISEKFYELMGGILGLLVIASVIGWVLRRRRGANAVIDNLNARIRAWW